MKQSTLKRAQKVKQPRPPWSAQLVHEDYEEPENSRCYANFDMSFLRAKPGQEPPKGWNVIKSVSDESKKNLDKFLHEIVKGGTPVEEFALWRESNMKGSDEVSVCVAMWVGPFVSLWCQARRSSLR